jgi:predicted CoA-binding protein
MRTINEILSQSRRIAVVGLSADPQKTSHGVAAALQHYGYRIYPVNPKESEILGEKVYPDLKSIPDPIDIVNVFRRPEFTPSIAREAVAIGARTLWLQSGIINDEARQIAESAGLDFVMDHCIMVEHRKHGITLPAAE